MLRHIGVFCLLFAAAGGLSFLLPVEIHVSVVMTCAMLVFIGYMGVSYILLDRRKKDPAGE